MMLLRVCVSPNNVRRINLPSVPESVDHLKTILQSKLELQNGFSLQFEDPEFGNSLCNLHDIDELPAEKAVLKVIWDEVTLETNQPPATDTSDAGSVSSLDTASVSSASSSTMSSQSLHKNLRDAIDWPSSFEVPKFSLDVELRLKKANDVYHQNKTPLEVPRDVKSEILSKLVQAMFEVKSYPTRCEVQSVAMALVHKHPCLTEDQPSSGWDAWLTSLWFKVGNYRFKLRQAGMSEVSVNRKRHGDDGQLKYTMKKSRRAEVNFLPDHPMGQTDESLEEDRLEMTEETKKKNIDSTLIREKMHSTFSLRRRELVEVEPLVKEIKE
ncbi:uncharacterized protein LOC125306204 [Alosa alosa]|nr:uncharacterized protein LOC125306204 [Alosa alosa]